MSDYADPKHTPAGPTGKQSPKRAPRPKVKARVLNHKIDGATLTIVMSAGTNHGVRDNTPGQVLTGPAKGTAIKAWGVTEVLSNANLEGMDYNHLKPKMDGDPGKDQPNVSPMVELDPERTPKQSGEP